MDNNIFIPAQAVRKEVRRGGGSPFWQGFWKEFNSPTEYDHRRNKIADEINPIVQTSLPDTANLYAEVTYSEHASSKSSRPSQIWEEANLEVIQSTDELTFTLAGKKADFDRLASLVHSADYGVAKGSTSSTTKRKNMSREVFAVSSIRSQNKGLHNRVDINLKQMIQLDQPGSIDCIIELYPDKRSNEYDSIYQKLAGYLSLDDIKKRDDHTLFSNLTYSATLTVDQVKFLLDGNEQFNFVRLIRTAPNYTATRSVTNIDPAEWSVNQPETNQILGVIDSGISSPVFNSLVFNTEKFRGKYTLDDKTHGTFVCSRALFSDQIAQLIAGSIDSLTPIGQYLDVQVLFKENDSGELRCDDDQLIKAIDEVTSRYPDIKVYNLSISSHEQLDERFPSELTEKLDKIANERDILFICVTGNNNICGTVDYNDIFSTHKNSSLLLSPGDTVSNLTVGSYVSSANLIDNDSGAEKAGYPSPFTRKGLIREKIRKPDIVSEGGNFLSRESAARLGTGQDRDEVSRNKYGVVGLSTDTPLKDIGTSFSAPIITNKALRILDAIKNSNIDQKLDCNKNISNLIKALLVHSTSDEPLPRISDVDIREALGFGASNTDAILGSSDDKVTILYCDKLDGTTKKHKLGFQLPDFVQSGNIKFTFSLAYNPPVDRNFAEYSMIDVTGKIRVPYYKPNDPEVQYQYINASSDWRNHTTRGACVHHFNTIKRNGLRSNLLEVLVQMFIFEEYEHKFAGRVQEIDQPYAIAVTIEDLSESGRLRQEMLAMNQIESLTGIQIQV